MSCPQCKKKTLKPVRYKPGTDFAINGVSEINCTNCGYRECKFCHKELKGHEKASLGCKGLTHPVVFYL